MSFHVGQKVVFVGGKPLPHENRVAKSPLSKGQIYTIRELDLRYVGPYGFVGIRVHEHISPSVQWNGEWIEPTTLAYYFRPLTETKSKISLTEGAPEDSEEWDNRKRQKVRA